MRVAATIIGLAAILIGFFIGDRGPTDIQLGIAATGIVGGFTLCFLGVVLGEMAAIRRAQREILAILQPKQAASVSAYEPVTMSDAERQAYERRIAAMTPSRFEE